jgi:hypothetical protein
MSREARLDRVSQSFTGWQRWLGVCPRSDHLWSMLPVALSTTDSIQLAIAIITGIAALTAVVTVGISITNERRRSQPIVIAHEARSRYLFHVGATNAWAADVHIKSEGGGPAFNVRFGIQFRGVRFPYKLRVEDPDSGNVQRVLAPGDRIPPEGAWPVLINSLSLWGLAGDGKLDPAIYWARYENAQGQVWETTNPGDRSERLAIKRVQLVRFRERREERARERAGKAGADVERDLLADLATRRQREEKQPGAS